MERSQISVFTPSNTPPEVLERIFVQRHRLLGKIVDRLKRSMLTGDMHHALLIGPRGSGKTNMVALAQHRLKQQGELKDVMRVAWLGEDDTITGFIDLALGIADRLADEYPDEFETDYRSPYRGLPADDAAEAILNEIILRLGRRYLLVLIENMDAAFKGLGEKGQKRWRAFLQEKGRVATLATSKQIFDGVSDRDLPFWGFFDIHHLSPLSFHDARALIRNISVENGNHELVQFIETADGRYRIRSLHHLAGGNHRMYVLLSEFLTKESLDDLVSAFETLADELTPYFQERIRSLPAQQAKIVQSLAAMEGAAITVKEIAASTFIDERSCSKQLGELRNKHYVQSEKRGKESYYELAEPLMRLCLEVKNQRGKPLKLIARFLKAWFTVDDLKSQLSLNIGNPNRADAYRMSALELESGFHEAVQSQIDRDIEMELQVENYDEALSLAEELQCASPLWGRWRASKVKWQRGDLSGAITDLTIVIELADAPVSLKANALVNRGMTYGQLGETEKEVADYTLVIEMAGVPMALKANALLNRGKTHGQLGETEKAIADFTLLVTMPDAPRNEKAKALFYRGVTSDGIGKTRAALADYTSLIEMPEAQVDEKAKALLNRGVTHHQTGETQKGLEDYTSLIDMPDAPLDQKAKALFNRGVVFGQLGETEKELADYTSLIEMPDAPVEHKANALLGRGATYGNLGETEKELADYTSLVEMPDAPVEPKAKALNNLGVVYWRISKMPESFNAFQEAIRLAPLGSESRCRAMFASPEPLVETGLLDEVATALRQAFEDNEPNLDCYGGTPQDLFWMVLRRGSGDWDKYVATLVSLYVEFGATEILGRGLTQLIEKLEEGDYTTNQLDLWNSIWQQRGSDVEALEIPLRCLAAATETIKTKSDRPLFELPQEVRSVVRSLLTKTLGEI